MPQQFEYNEAMGSMPDHLQVLQNRITAAQEELARAGVKPEAIRASAISAAEGELGLAQQAYDSFIQDNPSAKQQGKPERIM